jgi:hypothetical protein
VAPRVTFASLREAEQQLRALDPASLRSPPGAWTPAQVLQHCAQSIEYSLTGYPVHRAKLFRATVGRLALRKFLGQGYMSHALDGPIPGAPALSGGPVADALARLLGAIAALDAHPGPLADHFAYGPVTREQYARVHAMHVADHLGAMLADGA